MAVPELYQFTFSHYNEKVRWALDHKCIPHRRHALLPGPHIPTAVWLSGQKSLPILRIGQKTFKGSAEIIEQLEQRYPKRSLFPRSLHARKEAMNIARWFDEEVGAQIRRAYFYETLPARRFSANTLSQGFPRAVRTAYRFMLPGLVPVFRLDMRITRSGHRKGIARTEEALDFVAENAGEDSYLVGDRFSVADLTAASILMITCFPPESGLLLDSPFPPQFTAWMERWQTHPGTNWVRRIFHRHRGSSAAID